MLKFILPGLLLLPALTNAAAPPTNFFDAVVAGKVSLDARLRWENATQSNLADANAFTLRTALGYTTASWDGLQAMVEMENVSALNGENNYNAAGTNAGGAGRTVIADPPATAVNQAWLGSTNDAFTLKGGRQRLVLDNARFVGDSGWRQNQQTFDAAILTAQPASGLNLFYGYSWRVNRVYGGLAPQPDFTGNIHLLHASYSGWSAGKLTAYAYLLDLANSPANSSNTVGASFAGHAPLAKNFQLTYRAEYAIQQDAGKNPTSYRADYRLAELGCVYRTVEFGAGEEVLGSDGGRKGFATPLATLHAFNGWADLFTSTPARGLRDDYVFATVALPGGFPCKAAYHAFASDYGDDYGHEWDLQVTHKLGPHVTALVKWADYDGHTPFFDTQRLWLQCEFAL